jgi:GNAT superfamily N-acetyltransferase
MQRQDVDRMIEWAASEGWNPGLDDGECFAATDPEGLLMGFLDREPIGCISVVGYDDRFGFLGLYIVARSYRGRGYGLRLWKAGLQHLGGRSIGLDGVLTQQENYRRSGFAAAHTNMRHGGFVDVDPPRDSDLIPLADVPFEKVLAFDRDVFPAPRAKFLRCWLDPEKRRAFAVRRDGRLAGYGVIRPSRDGFRIGPLFAADEASADLLFRALAATASGGAPLVIDVPAPNAAGVALARRYNLKPVFETMRMYRGADSGLPLTRVYGITTLEQG